MKSEIIITLVLLWQGVFDFAGWYGIFKENSGHKYEWLYRLIKELHDFVLWGYLMIFVFGWDMNVVGGVFILKWFGWCDLIYIVLWQLFNLDKTYWEPGKSAWWLWWTPLGLLRSRFVKRKSILKGIIKHPPQFSYDDSETLIYENPNLKAPGSKPDPLYFMPYKLWKYTGCWWFKKGLLTGNEFYFQCFIGFVVSDAVMHFGAVSWIWKIIINLI